MLTILTLAVGMIQSVVTKVVSCIDPWVYAVNHPKFKYLNYQFFNWKSIKYIDLFDQNNSYDTVTLKFLKQSTCFFQSRAIQEVPVFGLQRIDSVRHAVLLFNFFCIHYILFSFPLHTW